MDWIKNANKVKWFSHKNNGIDTNIRKFVPGSGGTFVYYNHDGEDSFCSFDLISDFVIEIAVTSYIMNSDGVYVGEKFPSFYIILEQLDNPEPSLILKSYFREKKIKRIIDEN